MEKKPLAQKIADFMRKGERRAFLIVFGIAFALCTIVCLQQKPIDTHPDGADGMYYYNNAKAFSEVWKDPFTYIPKILFRGLSYQDSLNLGLNPNSDFDTFYRAPVYMGYLSLWMAIFGISEASMLFSQIFLLALLFAMVFLLLRNWVSRPWAIVGLILLSFCLFLYIGAIWLITEIMQALLFLILVQFILRIYASDSRGAKEMILLALLFFLFIYSKMSLKFFIFFFIPLIVLFEFAQQNRSFTKKVWKNTALFLLAFLLLSGFYKWSLVQTDVPPNSNLGGWRNYYAGANILTDGFNINVPYHNKEFRDNISKGKDKNWFINYSEICKYAVLDTIRNHPGGYTFITLKKILVQLVSVPVNYDTVPFLINFRAAMLTPYFQILLILSLFFMFLRKQEWDNLKLLFFLLVVYLSAIYGLTNPDPRYFIPLTPFYVIFSLLLIHTVVTQKLYTKMLFWILLALPVLLLLLLSKDFWVGFGIAPALIQTIRLLLVTTLLGLTAYHLVLRKGEQSVQQKILSPLFLLFVYLLMMTGILGDHTIDHHRTKGNIAKKTIIMPESGQPAPKSVFLAVDVRFRSVDGHINLTFNGTPLGKVTVQEMTNPSMLEKAPVNKSYFRKPKWVIVALPAESLGRTNSIEIEGENFELYTGSPRPERKIPSLLYYRANENEMYSGPGSAKESRIFLERKIASSGQVSWIDGKKSKRELNIFIVTETDEGLFVEKRYEQVNQQHPKYLALFNPLEQGIVQKMRGDPGAGWVRVSGNLKTYLQGEMDRYDDGLVFY